MLDRLSQAFNPQTLGLLGLRMMQQSQSNQPMDYMGMLAPLFMMRDQNNPQPQPPQNGTQNLQALTDNQPSFTQRVVNAVKAPFTGASDYISKLKETAMSTFPDNPLMQQVAISQAIQESGVNPSKLATESNNYFGIKSPKGVAMATQEYVNGTPQTETATFAINPTMQDSFNQYKNLLSNSRYQGVGQAQTPEEAFQALSKAGYATDPRYAQKLASVYQQYVQPLYSTRG